MSLHLFHIPVNMAKQNKPSQTLIHVAEELKIK
jgi:hypothetical protein